MTWAVVQDGNRVREGSFEMCEEFVDWHQNMLRVQVSAETAPAEGRGKAVNSPDETETGHGIAAILDNLFSWPQFHVNPSTGE